MLSSKGVRTIMCLLKAHWPAAFPYFMYGNNGGSQQCFSTSCMGIMNSKSNLPRTSSGPVGPASKSTILAVKTINCIPESECCVHGQIHCMLHLLTYLLQLSIILLKSLSKVHLNPLHRHLSFKNSFKSL